MFLLPSPPPRSTLFPYTTLFRSALQTQAENVLTLASSSMMYIDPEILEMDEDVLATFLEEKPELKMYQKTLDEINRKRPHILSHREEALLAEASDPLRGAAQTFGVLNKADLVFPDRKSTRLN